MLQLTKDQLLSVLPLLIPHLQNPAFVIHTYAALTIERILFIKQDGAFLFVPFVSTAPTTKLD
jgi:exportin-2 (importin alpha re-exporter)